MGMGIIMGALGGLGQGAQVVGQNLNASSMQDQQFQQSKDLAQLSSDLATQREQAIMQMKDAMAEQQRKRAVDTIASAKQGVVAQKMADTYGDYDAAAAGHPKSGTPLTPEQQAVIDSSRGTVDAEKAADLTKLANDPETYIAAAIQSGYIDPSKVAEMVHNKELIERQIASENTRYEHDDKARQEDRDFRAGEAAKERAARAAEGAADRAARSADRAPMIEANRLKLEEKQAANDMTRAGQIASFDTMLGTLDRLATHPGLSRSVGLTGKLPTMPGSDSANFQAELETFQSQAFLPMVAQLKGMGALSDAEGKKLTAAVGALNTRMSEEAFKDSLSRIKKDMEQARARVASSAPASRGAPAPKPGNASTVPNPVAPSGGGVLTYDPKTGTFH